MNALPTFVSVTLTPNSSKPKSSEATLLLCDGGSRHASGHLHLEATSASGFDTGSWETAKGQCETIVDTILNDAGMVVDVDISLVVRTMPPPQCPRHNAPATITHHHHDCYPTRKVSAELAV